MDKFMKQIKTFWQDEDGLSAVEYVVAGTLIVSGLATAFGVLGDAIESSVENIAACAGDTTAGGTCPE